MAKSQKKIDQLGLSGRVQELLRSGILAASEIRRTILAEFPDKPVPSEDTFRRYIADIKDKLAPDAYQKIREHVDREVPKDLDALEELEALALAWAREGSLVQAERVQNAAEALAGELDNWLAMLTADGDPKGVARKLIARAVELVGMDDTRQEARLRAMNQATKIIALKLSQAGLLDDEKTGRIVILRRSLEEEKAGEVRPDGRREFRVVREADD